MDEYFFFFFFFSSRRRHTRYIGDWSSDVCSSDLALAIVLVGAFARNVIGKRVLQRTEGWLLRVPVFKTIYAPVRQLIAAFSPDNKSGFKRVVMVEDPRGGYALGFLTREFTADRGDGPEALIAVFLPTNHLYLGDIVICERDQAL